MILIFYTLLKPVTKDLSLLAALSNLVNTAVLVANKLTLVVVVSEKSEQANILKNW
jgi:hypothetical protein